MADGSAKDIHVVAHAEGKDAAFVNVGFRGGGANGQFIAHADGRQTGTKAAA